LKYSRIWLLILLLLSTSLQARWGWGSHRFINARAVELLPEDMSFWMDHQDYLSQHSVDPDTDDLPGYYHYIDIDYYPEFFTGTLPHTWEAMVALYGTGVMEDNGIIPWVIEWWLHDLKTLMQTGEWNDVWQIAAELGHYVADSHQALHLTLNYNGQLSGNYGIHSRYETQMINPHLDAISPIDTLASYWENPLDSVFAYIDAIYPLVDLIMDTDDEASLQDPGRNDLYYSIMWDNLGDTTIWSLNKAAVDLASIWYTAWVDAGSPYPAGVGIDEVVEPQSFRLEAYPNPFNSQSLIRFSLGRRETATVSILDLSGRKIMTLLHRELSPGSYSVTWDGRDENGQLQESGIYLYTLETSHLTQSEKFTLLK